MIYASTSCLKNPSNIIRVLNEYEKAGIENVELGSVHRHFEIKQIKKFNFNFLRALGSVVTNYVLKC